MLESSGSPQPKPTGLRAQAKAQVLNRILSAADELFVDRDYSQVTTKEIAKRAGIGEATLFRYFASKSDLLAMVYGNQLQLLIDELEFADESLATLPVTARIVRQRIHNFYEGRSRFYLKHPENAARYLRQSYDLASEGRIHAMEQGDRLVRRVTRILQEAQEKQIVTSNVDTFIVALNCHGIFLHEVNRASTRGLQPESIWSRVSARLDAQLLPVLAANNERPDSG